MLNPDLRYLGTSSIIITAYYILHNIIAFFRPVAIVRMAFRSVAKRYLLFPTDERYSNVYN